MEQNNFTPDKNGNLIGEKVAFPANLLNANNPISRRHFVSRIGKIIALGALSHFTLLAGKAYAADDLCPDGTPADLCPDGTPAQDVCKPPGNADNCPDGTPAKDDCKTDSGAEDVCFSGEDPQDKCELNGGVASGDVCWGGGATTNGHEQDTCQGGVGDECQGPGGSWWGRGHDRCKEAPERPKDVCNEFDDDTCYSGTNAGRGRNGGDDWCNTTVATDACYDGTDAQDLCAPTDPINPRGGTEDTCYYSTATDHCLEITNDSDPVSSHKVNF